MCFAHQVRWGAATIGFAPARCGNRSTEPISRFCRSIFFKNVGPTANRSAIPAIVFPPFSYALTMRARRSKEYACIAIAYPFTSSHSIVKTAIDVDYLEEDFEATPLLK